MTTPSEALGADVPHQRQPLTADRLRTDVDLCRAVSSLVLSGNPSDSEILLADGPLQEAEVLAVRAVLANVPRGKETSDKDRRTAQFEGLRQLSRLALDRGDIVTLRSAISPLADVADSWRGRRLVKKYDKIVHERTVNPRRQASLTV